MGKASGWAQRGLGAAAAVDAAARRDRLDTSSHLCKAGGSMWKQAILYGLLLALGTVALQWLDYQRMARLGAQRRTQALRRARELGLVP